MRTQAVEHSMILVTTQWPSLVQSLMSVIARSYFATFMFWRILGIKEPSINIATQPLDTLVHRGLFL